MECIRQVLKEHGGRFIILFAFWLLLTDSIAIQQIFVGTVCCLAVVAFSTSFRLPTRGQMRLTLRNFWRLLLFGMILLKEIFIANIGVAKILLSRDMKISPTLSCFHSQLRSPLFRVVLANAITLTPGTLTVSLDDDTFLVHCLTEKGAYEVAEWPLKYWLQKVENEGE
jgi:multicomponent Na+:H+ antiporter subunit E